MKHIKPAPQPKKDPEMESLYGFEARSKLSREYFSTIIIPKSNSKKIIEKLCLKK